MLRITDHILKHLPKYKVMIIKIPVNDCLNCIKIGAYPRRQVWVTMFSTPNHNYIIPYITVQNIDNI